MHTAPGHVRLVVIDKFLLSSSATADDGDSSIPAPQKPLQVGKEQVHTTIATTLTTGDHHYNSTTVNLRRQVDRLLKDDLVDSDIENEITAEEKTASVSNLEG